MGYKVILYMHLSSSNGIEILYLDLFCIEIFICTLNVSIIIVPVFHFRVLHSHNAPRFY